MNSADDITTYRDPQFHSPNFQRRTLGCSYDFPEKTYKKDKKWSIASIFRRKKKDESESSSEEDAQKKNFLGRRKKKSESKRKKPAKSAPFDHVVMPPGSRNSLSYSGNNYHEESAIMSDPTAGIPSYTYANRSLPQIPPQNMSESFSGSVDSVRKSKRGQAMARAEARRNSSKNGSSSEEESHHSNSSVMLHSEENLKIIEKQMSKRSRAARTERYLKRHSKDGENPHNYLRVYKSDAENWKYSDDSNRSPSRSPLIPRTVTPTETKHKLSHSSLNSQSSNLSGLSTIPPSHTTQTRYRISNSTSNPNYKPPQSMNDYNNSMKKYPNNFTTDQRSYSCDDNIHKTDVLHVQFPVMRPKRGFRNLSLIDASQLPSMRHPPPPPPPRDPNRTVPPNYFERPNTFYFDNTGHANAKMFSYTNPYQEQINKKRITSNLHPSYRSTSEDHLVRNALNLPLEIRPSSTTPESQRLFIKNEDTNKPKPVKEQYNYLTDKKPRSRKPIFIQNGSKTAPTNSNPKENEGTNKALNFWKQIDRQTTMNQSIPKKNRSPSPQMFSSHTQVQTKIFLPSAIPIEADTTVNNPIVQKNIISPPSPPVIDAVTKEDIKRKSCNLEEALNELEAIYNSLKLGDEDLLERAEQKEKEMLVKKFESLNTYPSCASKGALSDSSFSYEPFDTVDSPRRKRLSKKTHNLKLDDMAFRKINKDRANTIGDPQSVVSQVSYLMRSPVFSRNHTVQQERNTSEPDITLDDVVYRNVKHSNSVLKVVEPQPPFGIPLGPITPGANSDYLHAKPEFIYKPSFKHKKIPDIVKDDLAFRNLRKDCNKGPALPPLSNEDFSNNNSEANLKYLKKKRAQRSMSANIGNILCKNDNGEDVENHFKTLTDIADAMEIARKVLREKDNKISATKKAFMSDTDATYSHGFDSTKESRLNFLNELRGSVSGTPKSLSLKPPRGLTPERRRSPKESTPIPVSPLEDKRSNNSESTPSSLDDLLNALAVEAKETTERITLELQKLSEDKDDTVSKRLSEIDEVSQKAKLCDKLLDSKDFITVLKNPDDEEEVKSIYKAPVNAESATIIMSRFKGKDDDSNKSIESEHDYENLTSDIEVTLDLSEAEQREVRCLSPFEEKKAALVASFQVLKDSNDAPVKIVSLYDNIDGGAVTGEKCADVLNVVALPNDHCDAFTLNTNPVDQMFTSNCDIVFKKFNLFDDSEVSSGFHSCGESSHYLKSDSGLENNLDSLESLKSPKMVLETSNVVSNVGEAKQNNLPTSSRLVLQCIKSERDADQPGTSREVLRRRNDDNDDDCGEKPGLPWYRDPAELAFACSYGIACAHQFATVDLFAILSILFAVLSFIAALFL